ncbi:hypothetical protein MML48_7g00003371 [Holotrichia oblita]|uniref:Uncharacterized protein n=1 Tax=Holotrichia oblita TaxID=644536 RepID=A0ACB9SRD0_HOLOL|nr:hypothetical protein MML48_7g00003371 [Holotrichia oblita]
MSEAKADTVPGLGFKDKEKALDSLKILEGRDPDYQKLAVKGLIGRAKRVITLTKDKEKLQNINDAMKVFEDFIKDFEKNNKSKENRAYLPLASIEALLPLKAEYKIDDKQADAFLKAYKSVKGEYKNLRTVSSGDNELTWDIVRNSALRKLMKTIDDEDPDLWNDDLPSKEHMELILWGYSPEASKIKKNQSKFEEKLGKTDEEEDDDKIDDDDDDDKEDDIKERSDKNSSKKRKSESDGSASSDSDNEESPKKKSK